MDPWRRAWDSGKDTAWSHRDDPMFSRGFKVQED